MLNLRVVQARYGDCLIVESGSGKRRKHILVDGGPSRVYQPYLRPELERIAAEGGQVDLMVLTHVDNDHVLGLLELMRALRDSRVQGLPDLLPIRRIWHNAFNQILPEAGAEAEMLEEEVLLLTAEEELPGPEEPLSEPLVEEGGAEGPFFSLDEGEEFGIGEGVMLQLANELLGIPRNHGFRSGLITLEQARRPERIGSLRLWVIGPTQANLEDLRGKWMRWLDDKAGRVSFDISEPVVKPDDSVNNLSSIMLLFAAYGKRILLTGDGRSQDILLGLEEAGLMQPGGVCRVDVLKVPHHGSARNVVGELFDRVWADKYVFSADGLHGNPDWQTLVWLVEALNRQGRTVDLYATNWTPSLRRLVKEFPGERNHYRLTVLEKGATSLLIPVAPSPAGG